MAFDFSGLQALPKKIGDYLASPAGPVVLGQAAQGIMAEDPNSWQAGLGRAGVEMGRSNIAATAAKKASTERSQLANLLASALRGEGFQYTDDGQPGPTTSAFKTAPGGKQTFTLSGDQLMGAVGQSALNAAKGNQPSGSKPSGPTTPTTSPPASGVGNLSEGLRGNSLLPFILAQAVTGSGGGSTPLAGLTPEQIQGISRTDILGQEVLGRGVDSIFSNMVREAQKQYYDRLPQKKIPTSFTDMEINAPTGTWTYFDRLRNRMVDTGISATPEEISGSASPNWTTQEFVNDSGVRRSGIFKDGVLFKDLGVVPESTPEDSRSFDISKDLADIEARIQSDDAVEADYDNFNSRSEGRYFYIHKGSKWGDNFRKVELPPGVRAKDMYDTLILHPKLTVDDILRILSTKR